MIVDQCLLVLLGSNYTSRPLQRVDEVFARSGVDFRLEESSWHIPSPQVGNTGHLPFPCSFYYSQA